MVAFWLLSSQAIVWSQNPASSAKIIHRNGDILLAKVQLPQTEQTPQSFLYQAEGEVKLTTLRGEEIQSIAFENGPLFERFMIDVAVIDEELIRRSAADYTDRRNRFNESVLVEKLVSSAVELYQFIDKYGYPHFFYKKREESELTYLPNQSFKNEQGNLKNDKSYNNLLSYLAVISGCSETVIRSFDDIPYNVKSMIKAFKTINECVGEVVNVSEVLKRKNVQFKFGLQAGVTSFTIRKLPSFEGTVSKSLNPTFGIFLDLFPQGTNKLAFSMALYYQSAHIISKFESSNKTDNKEYWYELFGMETSAKIYLNKVPKLYGLLGMQLGMHLSSRTKSFYILPPNAIQGNESKELDGGLVLGYVIGAGYRVLPKVEMQLVRGSMPGYERHRFWGLTGSVSLFQSKFRSSHK